MLKQKLGDFTVIYVLYNEAITLHIILKLDSWFLFSETSTLFRKERLANNNMQFKISCF